jgi:hypothetical protein
MILKKVWFYGLVISLIAVSLFVRAFLPKGGFEFIWMSCFAGLIGCGVSITGLFFEDRRIVAVVSLIVSAIPLLFLLLTFWFGGDDGHIGRFLSLLDSFYLGETKPGGK